MQIKYMNFSNVKDWTIPEGSVNKVTDSLGRVIWEKQGGHDYSQDYFFVEDISGAANTLSIVSNGSAAPTFTVYYSTDQQHWTSMGRTSTTPITATVPANSKLYLKATTNSWGDSTRQTIAHNYMYCTGKFNVGGNIMSLLKGANFYGSDMVDGVNDRAFYYLFDKTNVNNTTPSNANKLVLPALTMATECYQYMFGSILVNLITAPVELPATTLARGCYRGMFVGNASLTSAPVLRATTLADSCYSGMFAGCTSLNQVTTYADDISATDCLNNWLNNVAATGTFYNEGTAVYTVDSPSGIPQGWTEVSNYFYVEDVSGETNTLSIKKNNSSAPDIEVFCSTDRSNWTSMGTTSTTAITATIPANSKLYLKATANTWANTTNSNVITASGNHNVGGNIMSLLYDSNFKNQYSFPADSTYTFYNLLNNNTTLVNAQNLVLPATTLAQSCYTYMFDGCTSLTTAPATLPATTLAERCYNGMFKGCTSLTTAPALPVTTLARNCYGSMFQNCSSLTTAPALPATTLADSCYYQMFRDCTGLTTAPELPATTLADSCYSNMFRDCTGLTTAPELPATTLTQYCYSTMFQGCTSLTTAPATLPATTLAERCYGYMFQNCTSLTAAPELPATTLAKYCYSSMFAGCTALTQAPATLPATTLAERCYSDMFRHCSSLTQAPELPATTLVDLCYIAMFIYCTNLNKVVTHAQDISATGCLSTWLQGVAAQGDFYNLGGATYTSGNSGIPTGWTEHNTL